MEELSRQELISDFVGRRLWAVVGASQDKDKFGYRVFASLRDAGYSVYPVNPRGGLLDGAPVFPTLADLPEAPEVVDMVVPPHVAEQVLEQVHDLGLVRVWLQPGAESDAAVAYCRAHRIQLVYRACAMVHQKRWG